MSSKVLIIGNGFIGSKLVTHLKTNKNFIIHQISGLKYFHPGSLNNSLQSIFTSFLPNYVINCVGYTGAPNVDGCEANKADTFHLNVTVPTTIANLCTDYSARFINISSGCVFDGYENVYQETDEPNYGLTNPDASWYSKTKHACELALKNYPNTFNFRIRMPVTGDISETKNYLTKILKYNNLINFTNSKTVVKDLLHFIVNFLNRDNYVGGFPSGNYNIVNPDPLNTKQIVDILDNFNLWNPNWNWIELDELYKSTSCKRSNCVLDSSYAMETTGFVMPPEESSIIKALQKPND
tara:strand:+ start:5737 stop:6624 length:888 start_codon:yes stop_codon:yes gene_type:complete